jgi:hypothetical protein
MSHTENASDIGSETARDLVTEYPQEAIAKRIKTGREKWNSCLTWDSAMELNRQFFAGELEVNILDKSPNPEDMENEMLQSLLYVFFMIWQKPRRFSRLHARNGEAFITRRMGSCCFMLPSKHRLLVSLMAALLDSQQLHLVVMYRGNADHIQGSVYNFNGNVRNQDSRSGSSSADLCPWSLFATESPEEVHSELFR